MSANPDRLEQFRPLLTKNPLHPSEARYALQELFKEVDRLRAEKAAK